MRKFCYGALSVGIIVCFIMSMTSKADEHSGSDVVKAWSDTPRKQEGKKMVVAYVSSAFEDMPDPTLMTHIYYAFGNVAASYDSVEIMNPEKFRRVAALKEQNPDLKVCLSIQTLKRDGFVKMTSSDSLRASFVGHCKRIVDEYNLDGIDLDWEFPATNAGMAEGGHPDDPRNYSYLARDLKEMLGRDKQISFYSSNTAEYNDLGMMEPYVDYVMVSGYNLGTPPSQHQSNLYPSRTCGSWSVSESVKAHVNKGIPKEKILIGIPFYARTSKDYQKEQGLQDNYVAWRQFDRFLAAYNPNKAKWDKTAKAPYFADKNGKILAAFDNERSIAEKGKYIEKEGLAGAFYWHYDSEAGNHSLARAVSSACKK